MGITYSKTYLIPKLKIVYATPLNNEIKIINEPISQLIKCFNDIKQADNDINYTKYLYYYKDKIHKILYQEEIIIKIDDTLAQNFESNFYLILLIEDQPEFINYQFAINYIKLFNEIKKNEKNKYLNIINSKILLSLINNYRNCTSYDEEKEETFISQLEEENKAYIRDNINILKELDLDLSDDDAIDININDLYKNIIKALIKKEKLADYDYSYNILSQLHLENIELCFIDDKGFSNDFLDIFDINNDFINKFIIKASDDMNNINKINFHYLLLKFICKSSFLIYQLPLLYNAHKKIIDILKEKNYYGLTMIPQKDIINRVDYIIEKLCDSNYYYNQYLSKKNKDTNRDLNDLIKLFKKSEIIYDILIEKDNNPIFRDINFVCENKKIDLNAISNTFNKYKEKNNKLINNFCCFLDYLKNINNIITAQICNLKVRHSFKLKLEFNTEEDSLNNDDIYNINVKYIILDHQLIEQPLIFEDKNILEKKINEYSGLNTLLEKLDLTKDASKDILPISEKSTFINSNFMSQLYSTSEIATKILSNSSIIFNNSNIIIYDESQNYKIINYQKQVKNENNSIKFLLCLKYLESDLYLCCGNGGKIILYDSSFNELKSINNLGDILYHISEKKSTEENCIELIACYLKYIYIIKIKVQDKNYNIISRKYEIPNTKSFFCIEYGNKYILGGIGITMCITELFNEKMSQKKMVKLSNESYFLGKLLISKKEAESKKGYIVLLSNELIPNGSNKLSIINLERNKIEYTIVRYSFTFSENSAYVIENNNKFHLLCACKSYTAKQNNGILLVNIYLDQNNNNIINLSHNYFGTENFEPYCFCMIKKYINEKKNIKIFFFFSGGFNSDLHQGVIRLYKLTVGKNIDIEYLQDIEIGPEFKDKIEIFDMPVSTITQSEETGEIIITTIDGKLYVFSTPNLDFYINLENDICV